MLNVFNLSFTDAIGHYKENRSGDLLRVDFIACELPLDSSEELVSMALLDRFSGRIPPLVIEPTDEHWQLSRELGRFLDGQPVTQRMQRCPQSQIGLVPRECPVDRRMSCPSLEGSIPCAAGN